jgi:hypothetical protein
MPERRSAQKRQSVMPTMTLTLAGALTARKSDVLKSVLIERY